MEIQELIKSAVKASKNLLRFDENIADDILLYASRMLRNEDEQQRVLKANAQDLARMSPSDPKYDRLKLTPERLDAIAFDMQEVVGLSSPVNKVLSKTVRPNGMKITKIAVPFGVVGVVYEARPNVTFDVFALCLKSGNACVLKGGSDADASNQALVDIIQRALQNNNVPRFACTLLPPSRESTTALLQAVGMVDLVIPRGSADLINYVRTNALVPVIETGAGICHTYFDKDGNRDKGRDIINNAKTRRVSVCNALDCLIINEKRLYDLPYICGKLQESNVVIYADDKSYSALEKSYPQNLLQPANESNYGTEYLDYKMSIKTVSNMEEALEHIAMYGSKHSECIVSEDAEALKIFKNSVDAACVYANVSTAFTDGAQFGFGAEIGISTQKMHARGPMALNELTTYKYLIEGDGQIRK